MSRTNTVTVERKKLYEQVWSTPGQQLAAIYGISDVGLAKACKKHDIPRPPRGYWARIAAGQRIRKPPLPERRSGNGLVYIKGWNMTDNIIQKLIDDNRNLPATQSAEGSAQVHPLVAATREQLMAAKPDHDGLLRAMPSGLNVCLSPQVVDRGVTVMDALITRWQSRGGSVSAAESGEGKNNGTRFAICSDSFGVRLVENIDESKPLTDPSRLTGHLALYITGDENRQFRRRWSDTKTQRLERMLPAFVETLVNALAVIRQARLDAECVTKQKEKVEALRKAANRDSSREFYSRQELMQNVDQWHDAQRIRGYLAALKAAVEKEIWRPSNDKGFKAWLEWAERFANSIDPIIAGPHPEGERPKSQNVPVAELDFTANAKSVVGKLSVHDTDALWKQSQDTVRGACGGKFGPVWNEITRVLEGLHYDVSKREQASEWW